MSLTRVKLSEEFLEARNTLSCEKLKETYPEQFKFHAEALDNGYNYFSESYLLAKSMYTESHLEKTYPFDFALDHNNSEQLARLMPLQKFSTEEKKAEQEEKQPKEREDEENNKRGADLLARRVSFETGFFKPRSITMSFNQYMNKKTQENADLQRQICNSTFRFYFPPRSLTKYNALARVVEVIPIPGGGDPYRSNAQWRFCGERSKKEAIEQLQGTMGFFSKKGAKILEILRNQLNEEEKPAPSSP